MKNLYRPYCNEKYVFERFKDLGYWATGLQLIRFEM